MRFPRRRRRSVILRWVPALAWVAVVGCGGETGPTLVPVSGTVSMDGNSVTTGGTVSYRSVNGRDQAGAAIQPDGTYSLKFGGKEGTPAGTYRVVVFVTSAPIRDAIGNSGLPGVIVNKKFLNPATTPLSVEVKEDVPRGHYDLAVTN